MKNTLSLTAKIFSDQNHPLNQEKTFTTSFQIGRSSSCEISFDKKIVSRNHAEITIIGNKWWVHDLGSLNGTFVNGEQIDRAPLSDQAKIEFGKGGPIIIVTLPQSAPAHEADENLSLTYYKNYYLKESDEENVGTHTRMMRLAFSEIQKKQKRKYGGVILLVTCLFLVAGSMAIYKHQQIKKQKELAAEIFYSIKALELEFAGYMQEARGKKDPESIEKVKKYQTQKSALEKNYSQFVDNLKIYKKNIPEHEKLILHVARTFGESEIFIPDDFVQEVLRYIEKWKTTKRLTTSIARANKKGYTKKIAETMLLYDIPPHFFYLALQESNFDINACGPETRWGIAKGMWQFIPETATNYGLSTGPLQKYKRPDPQDERHDFEKSTKAAAKYLRSIYDTDAQASGLLVMASYNWGENRVNRMIREMPLNPKDRNFWKFLKQYKNKIPKETYDYVFMIFSAAVIGENPKLFGFDFDNPLGVIDV